MRGQEEPLGPLAPGRFPPCLFAFEVTENDLGLSADGMHVAHLMIEPWQRQPELFCGFLVG